MTNYSKMILKGSSGSILIVPLINQYISDFFHPLDIISLSFSLVKYLYAFTSHRAVEASKQTDVR